MSKRPYAECDNCAVVFPFDQLQLIKRYWERVDEDSECPPDGECPHCGALAYETNKTQSRAPLTFSK